MLTQKLFLLHMWSSSDDKYLTNEILNIIQANHCVVTKVDKTRENTNKQERINLLR